ncbi:hypothetical protein AO072_15750 [Pseudomonas syringae ICMP 13102]|nr:hypothetical protein AO072_15750 [Pseudomonas syringae ICMP 13102]KWS17136.1 hypothetical protein AL063_24910 [Pseudomonas syringae pv. syringae]PHN16527.1 hypothetical protein AO256_10230 [Pseudomonas syringae]KWS18955.1 hypothetical protein AL062_24180 [Pseudomonas syringae pv. syringae]KWS25441.1 hypothetical protein AL061_18660 [Pseudomonas syringae pv. syringae]
MAGETTASAAMTAFAAMAVSDVTTASAATEAIVAGMTTVGVAEEMAVIMDEAGAAMVVAGIAS